MIENGVSWSASSPHIRYPPESKRVIEIVQHLNLYHIYFSGNMHTQKKVIEIMAHMMHTRINPVLACRYAFCIFFATFGYRKLAEYDRNFLKQRFFEKWDFAGCFFVTHCRRDMRMGSNERFLVCRCAFWHLRNTQKLWFSWAYTR